MGSNRLASARTFFAWSFGGNQLALKELSIIYIVIPLIVVLTSRNPLLVSG